MNTSEQINSVVNNLSDKIGVAVETLAKALGVTVDKVYPILIKQAYVEGMQSLLWCIISIIVFYISIKLFIKTVKSPVTTKNCYGREEWSDLSIATCISTSIVIVISFAVFIGCFNICLSALINPEYYALQMILEKIYQLK